MSCRAGLFVNEQDLGTGNREQGTMGWLLLGCFGLGWVGLGWVMIFWLVLVRYIF